MSQFHSGIGWLPFRMDILPPTMFAIWLAARLFRWADRAIRVPASH